MAATPENPSGSDGQPYFESYPDRLVREAIERGDFEHNPYAGKPVHLGTGPNAKPWILQRLEREVLTGILPAPLAVRREKQELAGRLDQACSEAEARQIVEGLNERIKASMSDTGTGPRVITGLVDVEAAIEFWHSRHGHHD